MVLDMTSSVSSRDWEKRNKNWTIVTHLVSPISGQALDKTSGDLGVRVSPPPIKQQRATRPANNSISPVR